MVLTKMKRDIQGKFALKNDDYHLVRFSKRKTRAYVKLKSS
jgi:hypothetical protein